MAHGEYFLVEDGEPEQRRGEGSSPSHWWASVLPGMPGQSPNPRGVGVWVPIPAQGSISFCWEALTGVG